MGQEQSVPAPRRPPNRLSKPRTNSSTANLLSRSNLQLDAKDTQVNNGFASSRYSVLPVDQAAGDRIKDEKQYKQNKRRSLFRSKSSQEKEQLNLETEVESTFEDPSPLDRPLPRYQQQAWSRNNSITEEAATSPSQSTVDP